jgi:hypothetical protein
VFGDDPGSDAHPFGAAHAGSAKLHDKEVVQ